MKRLGVVDSLNVPATKMMYCKNFNLRNWKNNRPIEKKHDGSF